MPREEEYRTENRSPANIQHEVLAETKAKGWVHVEGGYYCHDEFGSVVREGGYLDVGGRWRDCYWMLYPPAVGMGVDITRAYAGPYQTAKRAMRAAGAYYEGSDWQKIIAKGGNSDQSIPCNTYIEFRRKEDEA